MTTQILNSAELVNAGWGLFSDIADGGFNLAAGIASRLSGFDLEPVDYDISFNPPAGIMQGFIPPDRPLPPDFDFEFEIPDELAVNAISIPDFGPVPTPDYSRPSLDFSGEPEPLDVDAPPAAPMFVEPEIPDSPTVDLPAVPDLLDLELPDPPDFLEIEFEGQRPQANLAEPDAVIDFTEEDYDSALLDEVRGEIQRMLSTGTGMPAQVEQMIVDRARERVSVEEDRAIDQSVEEWSARGFTIPPGALAAREQRIRQEARDRAHDLSREVFLQRRQEEIENYQFAVSQGIALETVLIRAHLDSQERAFQLALQTVDLLFRLLDARVAIFNAELAAYQTDAEVFRQRLEAEITKVQRFRAEIEAEALKEQINQSKVDRYVAQVQAIRETVNIYRARIEAVTAIVDTNNARAQAYAAQISGYSALVESKTEEYNAWRTKIEGQLGKVSAYEAETRAFTSRVQAYEAGVRAKAIGPQLEADLEDTRIRQFIARLEAVRAKIDAEGTKIQARASAFSSQAAMYSAEGDMAASQADTNTRQFLAKLEERRTEAESKRAKAELDVEQALRSGVIITGALDSAGRIASQVGAGAAAAVNLGASISGSENWNYSGDA